MSDQKVAILGCGPAGLFAAEAVESLGHEVVVISHKAKSKIPGSQYLHKPIPGICPIYPDNVVQYVRMGTPEGYARKVYRDPKRETGWAAYSMLYPSWNVVRAYERAWEHHHDKIEDRWVHHTDLFDIERMYDLVISTLPAMELCYDETHDFEGEPFWIQTLPAPYADRNKDIVIYNGIPTDHWYRWSILSGICSMESTDPPLAWEDDRRVTKGTKVVGTNCVCHPEVVRAGRWAEWRHGVLLNDAYDKTLLEVARRLK